MSSAECLREFVRERLTAAAEEIFIVFQRTIVEYEEELDRQRRLLDVVWKPELRLHRIELPQQHVYQQEETLIDQERTREPPQIKQEVEEVCSSELELKLGSGTFILTPGSEEQLCNNKRNLNLHQANCKVEQDMEEVCTDQEREQLKLSLETFMLMPSYEKRHHSESESDELPLFDNSDEAQDSHSHEDLTRNAAPKPTKTCESNAESHRKSFQCDTCGKEFNFQCKLNKHLRVHTGEKLCSCDICGKRFSMISVLNDHIRIHTGEKPYSCNICGKEFTHRSGLRMHIKTHTGEKPFLCKRCGRTFVVNSALQTHMRTHTGERPYTCITCSKTFRIYSAMVIHTRTHTDERPYLCKTCGKRFRQRGHLTVHIRTHTGEKPYFCKLCGKRFSSVSILSRHRNSHAKKLGVTVAPKTCDDPKVVGSITTLAAQKRLPQSRCR